MHKPHSPCLPFPLSRWFAVAALCVSLAPAFAAPPTLETVRGRRVEARVVGPAAGAPVVVFENGSRMTLDSWNAVIDGLGPDATVLAHNRAGYGQSDAVEGPRSGEAVVEGLRALLAAKGLKPPYILVGHSLGGLYVQWFAHRYPEEVRALVLVDAMYPRLIKKPQDFPWYAQLGKRWLLSRSEADEVDEIHATGESILSMPAFDDTRVVQLFNVPKSKTAVGVTFGVFDESPETRQFVRQLYPRARKHMVDSSHRIHVQNPELVVAAIREAMTLGSQRPASSAQVAQSNQSAR